MTSRTASGNMGMGEEGRLLGSFDRSNLDLKSFDVSSHCSKTETRSRWRCGARKRFVSEHIKSIAQTSEAIVPTRTTPSALISAGRSRVTQNDLEKTRTHIHTHARTRRIVIADFRSSTSSNRFTKNLTCFGESQKRDRIATNNRGSTTNHQLLAATRIPSRRDRRQGGARQLR